MLRCHVISQQLAAERDALPPALAFALLRIAIAPQPATHVAFGLLDDNKSQRIGSL